MGFLGGVESRINATFTASDKATPVIKKLRGEVQAFGSKTGGPLGGLISGFGGLSMASIGLAAGVGAVAGVIGEATKAAIDEQQSIDRLNVSLKDNVPNWQSQSAAVEEAIKSGAALAFTADDERNALALLVTRTHDVGQATKLLATAQDLARLKSMDLTSAVNIVGKVFSGQVSAARRAGIAIDKTATSTQALAQIQSAAAGQGTKYAESTAGSLDKAAIAFHDAEVELGQTFAPAIKSLADGLVTVIADLGSVGDAFNNLHRAIDPNLAVTQDMEAAIRKQAEALGVDADAAVAFYQKQQNATRAQQVAAQMTLGQAIAQEHLNNMTESYDAIATKFGVNVGDVTAAVLQYTDGTGQATTATQDTVNITQAADGVVNQYAASVKGLSDAELYHHRNDYLAGDLKKTAEVFHHVGGEMNHTFNTVIKKAGTFPQSIHDQIVSGKGQVRAAMADIAWAMKHPFADDQYVAWLHKQIAKAEREKLVAQKRGDAKTVAEIQATIDAEQAIIDSLHGGTVTVSVIGQNYGSSGRHWGQGGRAGGGPVNRGETYLVGEHGPEVLHMGGTSGYVTQGRGSGGGQPVIHTHVYIDGREIAVAVDRRMGMGWSAAGSSSTRN